MREIKIALLGLVISTSAMAHDFLNYELINVHTTGENPRIHRVTVIDRVNAEIYNCEAYRRAEDLTMLGSCDYANGAKMSDLFRTAIVATNPIPSVDPAEQTFWVIDQKSGMVSFCMGERCARFVR